MSEWNKWVDEYTRTCTIRGLAPTTIIMRRRELDRWGLWLSRQEPRIKIREINQEAIVEYVRSRTSFSSRATVASIMSELRCMGEFLVSQGVWAQNPLRWIRGPKQDSRRRIPSSVETDHMKGLLSAAAGLSQIYHRQLMVTLLLLLYGTGIRRGELMRLNLTDWNSESRTLRIDSTKSNLMRDIPVPDVVAAALESYLPHRANLLGRRGRQDQIALFINNRGDRIHGHPLGVGIHRLARKAGIPLVTIHQFRHSCASDLLRSGVGVAEVQKVLGHACLATTFRYTHVADPQRRMAITKHPINTILASQQQGEIHE